MMPAQLARLAGALALSNVLALAGGGFGAPVHAQQPSGTVATPNATTVDAFDSVSLWRGAPADGVDVSVHADSGARGQGIRIDFDFHGRGGYAVIRRAVNLTLPANYEFSFAIRGEAPVNTLEFKLADSSGENVWWSNTPNFVFSREWRTVTRKKRHISFAWGPTTDRELRRVFAIEFAITAGSGGKGSVWIDDLTLTPLPPPTAYTLTPRVVATARDTVDIDFLERREFGGLVIGWERNRRPGAYEVLASTEGVTWRRVYGVTRTSSPPAAGSAHVTRDYLRMPETDARYLRLVVANPDSRLPGYGIPEISVQPLEWAPTANDLFLAIARDAPRGSYPKYLSNEQSYWTVIGADRDSAEAMINEEGMVEVGRGQFSIEPFLFSNGKLITWSDARSTAVPDPEALPLPRVLWSAGDAGAQSVELPGDLKLSISTFAAGPSDSSVLHVRYRVTNSAGTRGKMWLYLALRPFQVNPPWQFLNGAGGVALLDTIALDRSVARASGNMFVHSLTPASGFGAAAFHDGNIVDWLRAGKLPKGVFVVDPAGSSSAAFGYSLDLAPYATSAPIDLAVPLRGGSLRPGDLTSAEVTARLKQARSDWREKLGRVRIGLPPSGLRYTQTLRANLGYVLINRDGPAIQPGSRSYSRSWIRDGSLTSTALLRMGHAPAVKEFVEWYATHQYDNGKIPCCVDEHGATPVPENDSHGQFIYLVAEYYRHTGDKEFLEKMWPPVAKAVSYMDSLRKSRMTEEYQTGANRAFFGLLPESISHEGYSAKPMHSYWDDFFALRGFKDAAFIARELAKPASANFAQIRDDFRGHFYESIRFVVDQRNIDFIPGSAELADFDATSTTVAVSPGGEAGRLPVGLLERTFDKYFQEARERALGLKPWDGYTPYELRAVGTHVQLGQRARAHELLDFFFRHQRPAAWYQWAEVVYHDASKPSFIGDMPHTWVGSDYIRSFLDMFAFERESDSSLVVGAGVKEEWVTERPGLRVANLSTHYGALNYDMHADRGVVTVNLRGGLRIPPGGIVVQSPLEEPILSASIDGAVSAGGGTEVRVVKLPATVIFRYAK